MTTAVPVLSWSRHHHHHTHSITHRRRCHRHSQLVDSQRLAGGLREDGQRRLARQHLVDVLSLPLERAPVDHVDVVLVRRRQEG